MSTTFELSGTRPRILVVDNNQSFTRTARRLLQLTGRYLVREENDPRRVLETALGFQPDLILLDLIMPELDGAEVAVIPSVSALGFLGGQLPAARQFGFGRILRIT